IAAAAIRLGAPLKDFRCACPKRRLCVWRTIRTSRSSRRTAKSAFPLRRPARPGDWIASTSTICRSTETITTMPPAPALRPAVANMSLGGGASSALDTAVNNSINDGVTYSIAAGNSNADACTQSPARVPNAITVGATTSTDARSSFSNFGTCVDIFAPGSSITSSWNTSDTATNTISGTSMATPHVTGVAALYLQASPAATPQQVRDALAANATAGVVASAGSGTPNLLLFENY